MSAAMRRASSRVGVLRETDSLQVWSESVDCFALFNAHLDRRRDDRLRDEDRIALASALYAELSGIHRTSLLRVLLFD
jgi:hypothetical protein